MLSFRAENFLFMYLLLEIFHFSFLIYIWSGKHAYMLAKVLIIKLLEEIPLNLKFSESSSDE